MTQPDADSIGMPNDGWITRADLRAAGVTAEAIRHRRDAGRWRSPYRGVYNVGSDTHPFPDLLAAHLHLGPESFAVLTSALALHQIEGCPAPRSPQFAVPPGLEKAQRADIDLHFWRVPHIQLTHMLGIPATTAIRTLADSARLLPREWSVACLDSAMNRRLITQDDLPTIRSLMSRRRRCVRGRAVTQEARMGAQSPLETRVRLRASDAGLPPDRLQVPIESDAGLLLGYGDMGWRLRDGTWLIAEADGRTVHELPAALLHDRRRQNSFLAEAGISIVRFTWEDCRTPDYIPGVLRPLLRDGGWSPRRP